MNTYVAFLRGINVNGRIIKQPALVSCFDEMGFTDVTAFIQSGNVVFSSDTTNMLDLRTGIEAGLTKTFEYPAKAFIVTLDELRDIVANCPFATDDEGRHNYVVFSGRERTYKSLEIPGLDPKIETVKPYDQVIYWNVPKGMSLDSKFAKHLSKSEFRDRTTTRNLNTLKKLLIKIG